jgi:TP53 regulating kinase-like protein
MKPNLLFQGAEAKIFLLDKTITKARIPKGYRHPQIDKQIRTRRTRSEAKILTKALKAGANIPKVISSDKFNINIEYIDGDRLSETLNSYPEKKQFEVMKQLGEQTALLHKNNIIHGDLTTSNTILKNDKLFIIDFGLGFISTKQEDKAVDLHLIKQALEAKHFQNHEALFKNFSKGYQWEESKEIIKKLETVEKRGRYKH